MLFAELAVAALEHGADALAGAERLGPNGT
jgi:hypothetical protein